MCKRQIEFYCQEERTSKDLREIVKCLVKNDDKLSTECKQEVQRFVQASRQTTPPGGGPLAALGGLAGIGAQLPSLSYDGRFTPGSDSSPPNPDLFAVVRFSQSKAKLYRSWVRLAKRAHFYSEVQDDGEMVHICAFDKSAKGARLAYIFLERVRRLKDHMCFISGRPEKITWRVLNVLDCYAKGLTADNQKAYCQVETDRLFEMPHKHMPINPKSLKYENVEDEQTPCICPCKQLEGFLMLSRKSGHSFADQITATAEDKKISLCPLFSPNDFRELLTESKRYW